MKYDLKEVATVSSKQGLYKILKPTRSGVIIESLDESKKRMMIQTRHKISLLHEISIFTLDEEGSVALEDVFAGMYEKYGKKLPVTAESDEMELRQFMDEVLPQYDEDKVYLSDMKKLVSWYDLVNKYAPPIEEKKETKKTSKEEGSEEKKNTKKSTPKAKKAASK